MPDQLKEEYVECRAYGHAWDREVPRSLLPANVVAIKGWIDAIRCMRCTTIRVDQLDWAGVVTKRDYIYEDDYSTVTYLDRPAAKVALRKSDQAKAKAAKNANGKEMIEEVEERTTRRGSRKQELVTA